MIFKLCTVDCFDLSQKQVTWGEGKQRWWKENTREILHLQTISHLLKQKNLQESKVNIEPG